MLSANQIGDDGIRALVSYIPMLLSLQSLMLTCITSSLLMLFMHLFILLVNKVSVLAQHELLIALAQNTSLNLVGFPITEPPKQSMGLYFIVWFQHV